MFWIVRARLSVPPPGPAVATNSIDFVGFQSAEASWGAMRAAAPASAARVNFTDMFRSRCGLFGVGSGERLASSPVARRRGRGTAEGGGGGKIGRGARDRPLHHASHGPPPPLRG